MKSLLAASAAIALLAGTPAIAAQSGTAAGNAAATTTSPGNGAQQQATTAQGFVEKAGQSNLFEIKSSRLALDKTKNQQVRDFAQRMIDDHQQAGQKLKSTLSDAQLRVAPPQQLDQEHASMLEKLQSLRGADFDRTYVKMQTQGHEKTIALFEFYAQNGDNADLRQFASNLLPTLQQHYEMIQSIGANSQS